ncbi:hypothetical protein V1525DRAFT_415540 [Lipomyces kononenkoae]|uniref:Uncharacterized protein n=1 Tax=Lipomyces kononenkoae TaxID=34357 RepID=A0ACC3SRK7_LIPKO
MTGANGAYVYMCLNTWRTYFGIIATGGIAGITQCAVTGIALLMLNYGNLVLQKASAGETWFYDSGSVTQNKMLARSDNILMSTTQVAPELFLNHTRQYFHPHTQRYVTDINKRGILNVTLAASLFHNRTGYTSEMGYVVQFKSHMYDHTVLIPPDSLEDAFATMKKFNGSTYVQSDMAYIDDTSSKKLKHRQNTYQWVSYTSWGGDMAYIRDLEQWGEYNKFADEYQNVDVVGDCGN